MCYTVAMTAECLTPEVQVIADWLADHEGFDDPYYHGDNAQKIWYALIEHWQNRSIVTPIKTKEKIAECPPLGNPVEVNAPVTDVSDLSHYETHVVERLDNISAELYYISNLPLWSEKERIKLDKLQGKLSEIAYRHHAS